MIVDGRKLADGILTGLKKEIKKLPRRLSVGAVLVGENPASESFLRQKAKVAEFLGIDFQIFRYDAEIKTEELIKKILKINKKINGIIIQLPLPKHIKTKSILNAINPKKDIDALSKNPKVLAPTVEAVKFIFEKYVKSDCFPSRDFPKGNKNSRSRTSKNILIVGRGRLVGQPIYKWLLMRQDSNRLKIIDIKQKNQLPKLAREADIIISGTGKAGLIKGDIIKKGAILIDFGFSYKNGKISPFDKLRTDGECSRTISGDFDFAGCVKKAKIITPVPGGMGPIMVVMFFKNLVKLNKNQT